MTEEKRYIKIEESEYISLYCMVSNLFVNTDRGLLDSFKSPDSKVKGKYKVILDKLTKHLNLSLKQDIFSASFTPFEIKEEFLQKFVDKIRKEL